MILIPLLIIFIGSIIGAYGGLALKFGANKLKLKTFYKNKMLYYGIGLYIIASFFTITALKFGELSLVYPATSITYIWIPLLSKKYLKEKINFKRIVGILFIIIGVTFIGLGS